MRARTRKRDQFGVVVSYFKVPWLLAADSCPKYSSRVWCSTERLLKLLMKDTEYSEGDPGTIFTAKFEKKRQFSIRYNLTQSCRLYSVGEKVRWGKITLHRYYQAEGNHRVGLWLCVSVTEKLVVE